MKKMILTVAILLSAAGMQAMSNAKPKTDIPKQYIRADIPEQYVRTIPEQFLNPASVPRYRDQMYKPDLRRGLVTTQPFTGIATGN